MAAGSYLAAWVLSGAVLQRIAEAAVVALNLVQRAIGFHFGRGDDHEILLERLILRKFVPKRHDGRLKPAVGKGRIMLQRGRDRENKLVGRAFHGIYFRHFPDEILGRFIDGRVELIQRDAFGHSRFGAGIPAARRRRGMRTGQRANQRQQTH